MTVVYGLDCTPLKEAHTLKQVLPRLDDSRRQRIERLQIPEKRAQCVAAGILLTYLCGENKTPPPLFHGSRGKPYLRDRDDRFFSLSHTGDWVFCALSNSEVGLDAQIRTDGKPAVIQRHFTQQEQEWLNVQSDKANAFTRLWTMKEAYVKFTGFGLVLPLSSFSVPLPPADGWDDNLHCGWALSEHECIALTVCGTNVREPATLTILTNELYKSLSE